MKDIKSERPKITQKDHLRLLFVSKWFLEFFLAIRSRQLDSAQKEGGAGADKEKSLVWGFDLVGEIVERGASACRPPSMFMC